MQEDANKHIKMGKSQRVEKSAVNRINITLSFKVTQAT